MEREEWLPMFDNPTRYQVNWRTGEIKTCSHNYYGKVLTGRIYRNESGLAKGRYYVITYPDGTHKSKKGHRIVAEAVLQRDLTGIPISHKGYHLDDSFENLIIGKKNKGHSGLRVIEYYRGEFKRTYLSVRSFERATGLSHHGFKKIDGERVRECGYYRFVIDE